MSKKWVMRSALGVLLLSSSLMGANWADKIQLKGFMSTVYQQTDSNNSFNGEGIAGISEDGSWNGTKLGINLMIPINEKITVATQFLSIQEGEQNFMTHLDWAIMTYRLSEEFQLRAGKIKFPTGLVNEYRDVGNSYPWISAPVLFYSTENLGTVATSESYVGLSGLSEYYIDDTLISVEVFGGENEREASYLSSLIGAKVLVNWDDAVNMQAVYYQGEMVRMNGVEINNGLTHSNLSLGLNFDLNNFIGYGEWTSTDTGMQRTSGDSWYATLGYQIDNWLPHITYQNLEKGLNTTNEQKQNMTTLGLRYDLFNNADIKLEYSRIKTSRGQGLFENNQDENVNLYSVAFDLVF